MTPRTSSPVTTHALHGRTCHSCSPASTSIRANAASAVGLRPSAILKDPSFQAQSQLGSATIIPNEQATPGKLARTEVVVEADAVPLSGRTRVGLSCRTVATEGEARRVRPGTRTRFRNAFSTRTSASRSQPERSSSPPGGRLSARRLAHAFTSS